jgi:ankyrin repeat protein
MHILNTIKILLVLFTLLTTSLSSALIATKEFKLLCNYSDKNKINNLTQELAQINADNFYSWISNFDNIYTSPLIYAVYKNNIPIIKLLIDTCLKHRITYWEFLTHTGMSILSVAAREQHVEAVTLLLKYNHPVSMDKANNTSALHQAAIKDNIVICRLIIAKDSNLIHCKDIRQITPINYLIENNEAYYVLELLENFPANKNIIPLDMNGKSYLHHAVINFMDDVVHCLLAEGFDYNQKDYSGVTPLGLAKYQQDSTILHLLESEELARKNNCCGLRRILSGSNNKNINFYSHKQNYKYLD